MLNWFKKKSKTKKRTKTINKNIKHSMAYAYYMGLYWDYSNPKKKTHTQTLLSVKEQEIVEIRYERGHKKITKRSWFEGTQETKKKIQFWGSKY